jgi:hypothetical protein
MPTLTNTPARLNPHQRLRAGLSLGCVLFAASLQPAFAQSETPRMPSIAAENLNERAMTLPADLPAEKTLVLMAFQREQQEEVDTWIKGMDLTNAKLPWLEVPVVGAAGSFRRGVVNGGMRMGIRDEAVRERIVTLFTDRVALLRTMGLPGEGKVVLALVMNRSGEVLAQAQGRHSSEKAQLLLAALQAK